MGIDKAIFPTTHPYFDELNEAKVKIEAQAKAFFAKETRNEVRDWAKQNLANGQFEKELLELPMPVTLTNQEIRSITGKNHAKQAMRNELLYILPQIWERLEFVGTAHSTAGKHAAVLLWFYYKLDLDGELFYFNFQQIQADANTQRIGIYSIGDKLPEGDDGA